MKKLVYASVTLALFTTACTKSSNSPSSPISATLSGKAFVATGNTALWSKSQNAFIIFGWNVVGGDSTGIELDLNSTAALGTAVTFADGQVIEYADSKNTFEYSGDLTTGHGSVTINTWDTVNLKVSGTFTGVLGSDLNPSDSVVISNGQFSVMYQKEP